LSVREYRTVSPKKYVVPVILQADESYHFAAVYEEVLMKLFVFVATAPQWARVSSFTRFLVHTQRNTTVGMTPLDE